MNKDDLEYVKSRYQKRIATDGVSFKSMNSGTVEKQIIRHALHRGVIQDGDSVLDVGFGVGMFYQSLQEAGLNVNYTGFDIVPEYVEHCRKTFPKAQFHLHNVFEQGFLEEYDVIVASQVFNARYPTSNNWEVLQRFLTEAMSKARRAVTVDMLTSYADFNQPELYYFKPEELFAFGKSLTRLVGLRHDYLPFEFTLQLRKMPS